MEEDPRVFFWPVSEIALVPDGSLVKEKRLTLGIPVGRHLESGRFAEVILGGEGVTGLSFAVQEPPVGFYFMVKAEEAVEVGVHDGGPVAVERGCGTPVCACDDHGRKRGCGLRCAGSDKEKTGKDRRGTSRHADEGMLHFGTSSESRWPGAVVAFHRTR